MSPVAYGSPTTTSTSWPIGVPKGSRYACARVANPTANANEKTNTVLTPLRIDARLVSIRRRSPTSSRVESARAINRSPSLWARDEIASSNAQTTRSAQGSSTSSANCSRASRGCIPALSRAERRADSARMGGGLNGAVAMIA
jgi:hypothetical protein